MTAKGRVEAGARTDAARGRLDDPGASGATGAHPGADRRVAPLARAHRPGHSNLVGAITADDRSVVVKAAQRPIKRADVVRESVVLRLMEDTGVAPVHLASSSTTSGPCSSWSASTASLRSTASARRPVSP